jgi:hypothetical protein
MGCYTDHFFAEIDRDLFVEKNFEARGGQLTAKSTVRVSGLGSRGGLVVRLATFQPQLQGFLVADRHLSLCELWRGRERHGGGGGGDAPTDPSVNRSHTRISSTL